MKTTYQDAVGAVDSESERSKRPKYSHPTAPAAAAAAAVGSPQSGGSLGTSSSPLLRSDANANPHFAARNSSEGTNTNLLAALQGANSSSLNATLQSILVQPPAAAAAAAPLPYSFDNNRTQQDLLRSLLLRQQMNNILSLASAAPRGGNDLQQQLLLAQLAGNGNNGQFSIPQQDGLNRNALFSTLGNMDLLTRAAALSGTGLLQSTMAGGLFSSQGGGGGGGGSGSSTFLQDNNANRLLIAQLLAAQRLPSASNLEAQIAAATGLSTGNQQPQNNAFITTAQLQDYLAQLQRTNELNSSGHGSTTGMVGQQQQQQQQQQQRQFVLGTSIGSSLPDAALRQMTNPPVGVSSSTNLLQTPALEERIRALRAGLVDKTPPGIISTSTVAAANNRLDPMANISYPLTSYEGDRLTPMALPSEQWVMSEYQCLLRQQIVFVEASANENGGKTQGRNKPIVAGQVGILCRHCACLPARNRPRGAIYFPAMLHRIYQAAQNMAHNHFAGSCQAIPEEVRQRLLLLKEQKVITVGVGKEYWVSAASTVGIREGEDGLFFDRTRGGANDGGMQKQPPATAAMAAAAAVAAPGANEEVPNNNTNPKEGNDITNKRS